MFFMQQDELIEATSLCRWHNAELSFVQSLQESGLVSMTTIQETRFIPSDELQNLEKLIRMHYEFGINLEGIETVAHLLQKIAGLNEQILQLKNRLQLYEEID